MTKKLHLVLEQLEDRLVPASYDWRGSLSSSWATAGNWRVNGQIAQSAPGEGDIANFDGNSPNCSVFAAQVSLLRMWAPYTGTLTITSGGGLYATDGADLWGGQVAFGSTNSVLYVNSSVANNPVSWNGAPIGVSQGPATACGNFVVNGYLTLNDAQWVLPKKILGANWFIGYKPSAGITTDGLVDFTPSPSTVTLGQMTGNLQLRNGATITTGCTTDPTQLLAWGTLDFAEVDPGNGTDGGIDAKGSGNSAFVNYGTIIFEPTGCLANDGTVQANLKVNVPLQNRGLCQLKQNAVVNFTGNTVNQCLPDLTNSNNGTLQLFDKSICQVATWFEQTTGGFTGLGGGNPNTSATITTNGQMTFLGGYLTPGVGTMNITCGTFEFSNSTVLVSAGTNAGVTTAGFLNLNANHETWSNATVNLTWVQFNPPPQGWTQVILESSCHDVTGQPATTQTVPNMSYQFTFGFFPLANGGYSLEVW